MLDPDSQGEGAPENEDQSVSDPVPEVSEEEPAEDLDTAEHEDNGGVGVDVPPATESVDEAEVESNAGSAAASATEQPEAVQSIADERGPLPSKPPDGSTSDNNNDQTKPDDRSQYPALPPLPTRRPETHTTFSEADSTGSRSIPTTPAAHHVTFQTPDVGGAMPDTDSSIDESSAFAPSQAIEGEAVEDMAENVALMDPNDPLMERVQAALYKQLSERRSKMELEFREKEDSVRVSLAKREAVGVELYTLQQQLARQQAVLESTQDNLNVIRGFREEAERMLRQASSQWKEHKEKANKSSKILEGQKSELEKLAQTIKQVERYNEELKSKILVAKRSTMKAEEDLVKQEQDKKRQDYFIDRLTDQLRRLQERRALFETQLMAQQKETKAAMETLHDAATEMEAIQFEKRQLLHQWNSSLIGLQKREEVIQEIEGGIQKNKNTLLTMNGEVSGYRLQLRKAQEQNEALTVLLNKLDAEVSHLKRNIANINEQREKLNESFSLYTKSLDQTEGELAMVMQERRALQTELSSVEKRRRQAIAATQKLESEIAEHLQAQLYISKGTQGTQRDNTKLRAEIHEKESAIANVQNDLGHIRLETLNVTATIRGMKEVVGRLDRELADRNGLVEKYEMEIRRRNDELGKKQGEVDMLNKKYDQLTAKNQDESMGPLEATIYNLSRSVQSKEKECSQLSQFWLRSQNELVSLTQRTGEIAEQTSELQMRLTVLSRKKMVVNGAFETELKEIRNHERNIRQLQHDMVKINTLLTKHAVVQNKLEENNLGLEQEFRGRLKNAELESIHMEQNVVDLRAEKQRALIGLVEAERQMMLWEKKIQLARETQAALDPNVGASEIREMEAEIHRMKLRHASMLKLQEKMIGEMEKSVWRRDSIASRSQTKGTGGGQINLQNAIADLTKKIRSTLNELKECDTDISTLQSTQSNLQSQLDATQTSAQTLHSQSETLQSQLAQKTNLKSLLTSQTLLSQRTARRYRDYGEGKYVFLVKDVAAREAEREKMEGRLRGIDGIVRVLGQEGGEAVKREVEVVGMLLQGGLAGR